ncbi:hypothetical protein ACFU5O_12270 [Streptomyces sp. NPDC057445]|uniref:hypothetical protein n=1 Tax=Streptomyces sp. NPDC057445 TaxID=3346136 RepID=UPI0036C2D734
MFEYELHQVNHAELVRRADTERLARQLRQARRSADNAPEGRVNIRSRFQRAA